MLWLHGILGFGGLESGVFVCVLVPALRASWIPRFGLVQRQKQLFINCLSYIVDIHIYTSNKAYVNITSTLLPFQLTSASTTMSSDLQYVYIPNLVGRQMLRIPVMANDDGDHDEQPQPQNTTTAPKLSLTTSSASSSREASPSPSVSVESVDEFE